MIKNALYSASILMMVMSCSVVEEKIDDIIIVQNTGLCNEKGVSVVLRNTDVQVKYKVTLMKYELTGSVDSLNNDLVEKYVEYTLEPGGSASLGCMYENIPQYSSYYGHSYQATISESIRIVEVKPVN